MSMEMTINDYHAIAQLKFVENKSTQQGQNIQNIVDLKLRIVL